MASCATAAAPPDFLTSHPASASDDGAPSSRASSPASTPPYSFATNLLGAFGAVKKKNVHTLKVLEELATLVKNRASVEEAYSQQLTRVVANHTHGLRRLGETLARKAGGGGSSEEEAAKEASLNAIDSTFRECVETFKADMLNKAVQRKQLATSILTDVFVPIEEVYNQLAAESKDLEDTTSALAKEGKGLEARYRTAHKKHEQAVQLATTTCNALLEQGHALPTVDTHALYRRHTATPRDNSPPPSSPFDLKKEELSNIMAGSPKIFSDAFTNVAKKDLTAWLLPTEKDRHQDLQATARDHMEMVELLRFACRDRYDDLVAFARHATHTLQKVLCQYQSCEERSVEELVVVLRKQVVFESSCLANEQYEAQVIFKVIEAVDRDRDLEAFIHAQKVPFPGADVTNTLKSLGLSSSSALPVPPPSFEGTITHTAPRPSYSFDSSPVVVLEKGDLPNLSSPAPHVVPATTVLRLLRGGLSGSRTPTPPLSSNSPSMRITNVPPPLLSPSASMASTSSSSSSSSSGTSPLPLVSPATASSSSSSSSSSSPSSSSRTTVPPPFLASLNLSAPTPAAATAAAPAARAATPPVVPVRMQSPLLVHLGTFVTPKPGLDDSENDDDEEEGEEEEEEEDEDEGFSPQQGKPTAVVVAQADARRKGTPSPLLPLEEARTADGGVEYRL